MNINGYVLAGLKEDHGQLMSQVVDGYEDNRVMIIYLDMADGRTIAYDMLDHAIRTVKKCSDGYTDDEWEREFYIRLKRLMYLRGINQSELAKQLDISQSQLSRYISGKTPMSVYMLRKIARVFGCTFEGLVNF